ncbi:MAG: adenylate cyclase [Actinomycetota bacterium]
MADDDLAARPGCFDGVIPPVIATCAADGTPNVTHLSQLHLVDADHVAVSNQFFGKTSANVADNGHAAVLVTDSQTFDTLQLHLRFERTETSGPLFDALKAEIDAIASLMRMEGVFGLQGADVYRVVAVHTVSAGRRS